MKSPWGMDGWMGSGTSDADLAPSSRARHHSNTATAQVPIHTNSRPIHTKSNISPGHNGASSQVFKEDWRDQHAAAQHTWTWIAACKANHSKIRQNQHASAKHTRSATEEIFSGPARRDSTLDLQADVFTRQARRLCHQRKLAQDRARGSRCK